MCGFGLFMNHHDILHRLFNATSYLVAEEGASCSTEKSDQPEYFPGIYYIRFAELVNFET